MPPRKLLPVSRDDMKLLSKELRELADACDDAAQELEKKGLEFVNVFGFSAVVDTLVRVRNLAASVIGHAKMGTSELQQLRDAKVKSTAKLIANDLERLKAHRTEATKKVAEKGPDYESKKKG